MLMKHYKIFEDPATGKLRTINKGFNVSVLILGPFWFFFNRLILRGLWWTFLSVIAGILTLGIGFSVVWIIAGAKANKDAENKYIKDGWKVVAEQ